MKTILKMSDTRYQCIRDYHNAHESERFSFLTGSVVEREDRQIVLVSAEPIFFSEDCYTQTSSSYLRLEPEVGIKMLDHFVMGQDTAFINIHHHPFSEQGTRFSGVDDEDDIRLDKLIRSERVRLQRAFVNISLVFDQTSFDARVTDTRNPKCFKSVDEIHCIGKDRIFIRFPNAKTPVKTAVETTMDGTMVRQDFLGGSTLSLLQRSRIGILGLGGLGSIIAESLVRLGCRDFVLVDDDLVEASNLNRLQGVGRSQVGKPKVRVVRSHLKRLQPDVTVKAVNKSAVDSIGFMSLSACDFVFSGLDNGIARAVINQLSIQYMVPLFDAAVQVALNPTNFLQRVFSVLPGVSACMNCSHFQIYDNKEVQAAFLSPEVEAQYRASGYITDIEAENAPSVYPLNLMAVGALMTDFLNYLAGFRGMAVMRYSNYQQHLLEVTEQSDYPNNRPADDCPLCSAYLGRGDDLPVPYLRDRTENEVPINDIITEYVASQQG